MPRLTRHERILLRHSERKDLFEEKFIEPPSSGTREFFEEESEGSHSSHKDPAQRAIRSSMGSNRKSQPSIPVRQGSASTSSLRPASRDGGVPHDVVERRKGVPRDTHFFETEARFQKITVPIWIPMTVFDEDVGDVSGTL